MQLGILVGGRSSRMGRPKGLLEYKGQTLIERAAAHAAALELEPVLIGDAAPYAGHVTHIRRCADEVRGVGPVGGLLAILRQGPCLLMACDMPFVELDHLRTLLSAGPAAAVVSKSNGFFEPLLARYDTKMCEHIEALLGRGETSFQALLAALPSGALRLVEFPPRATLDWDLPADIDADH